MTTIQRAANGHVIDCPYDWPGIRYMPRRRKGSGNKHTIPQCICHMYGVDLKGPSLDFYEAAH